MAEQLELIDYKITQLEKRVERLEKLGLGALIFLAGSVAAALLRLVGMGQAP